MTCGSWADSKWAEGNYDWMRGALTAPGSHAFCLNGNLLPMQKEGNPKKTWTIKEPYHILSYSYFFPVLANHLCWNWRQRKKGKDRARWFLSFHSFLNSSVSWRHRTWVELTPIKKWNKNSLVVQCFHVKNEIHMHAQALKYKLCNAGDSAWVKRSYICIYNCNCTI